MRRRDEVRGEQSQHFVVDAEPGQAGHLLPIPQLGGVGFVPLLNQREQPLRHEGRSDPLPGRGVLLCPAYANMQANGIAYAIWGPWSNGLI
jgi:hypothetical protein